MPRKSTDEKEETTDKEDRISPLRGSQKRRTVMKTMGLLGVGAATSQAGIGSVAGDSHENDDRGTLGTYDITTTFKRLDTDIFAGFYEPTEETARSHIALLTFHPEHDFTTGFRNEVAERHGYRALGIQTKENIRGRFTIEQQMPHVATAVGFLRDHPDVEYVILGGHSGGGQMAAMYQNIAENGIEIGRGDEKISPYSEELSDVEYPEADGVILIDAHVGYAGFPAMGLAAHIMKREPPRQSEKDLNVRDFDPQLNPYDPDHGYNPDAETGDAPSSYTDEFLDRWFSAQSEELNRMVDERLEDLEDLENDRGRFPDDDPYVFVHYNRLWRDDTSLLAHTQDEWPLHHAEDSEVSDEPVTEEQIDSVRPVTPPDYTHPPSFHEREAEQTTVRTFLSKRAIRPTEDYKLTESSIEGIDWQSSNTQVAGNLETVSAPLLITPTTGHYFVVQGELFYNHAGSTDKELHYVEGGSHGFSPIDPQYGDTRTVIHSIWNEWMTERFVDC